jgi:hypothetical protein
MNQPPDALLQRKTALRALAVSSAARVVGAMPGSGFFIDSDLLLTCAHVAGNEGAAVEVFPIGKSQRHGTVEAVASDTSLDAALVRLAPQEASEETQAAAVLAWTNLIDDEGFALGFASYREADDRVVMEPGFSVKPFEFSFVTDASTQSPDVILIPGGIEVEGGLSGAAIVSESLGAVVGIVRYRRSTEAGTRGGAGTPIAALVENLVGLRGVLDRPPSATNPWRQRVMEFSGGTVGQLDSALLELRVSGNPINWTVELRGPADRSTIQEVTAQSLGEDVGRAVFGWLSRRAPNAVRDVDRCALLLGLAAFPGDIGRQLRALRDADVPFALRLRFQAESELQDIPWELAIIPETDDRIATIAGSATTRLAPWREQRPRVASTDIFHVAAIVPKLGADAQADQDLVSPFTSAGARTVDLIRSLYEGELDSKLPRDGFIDVVHYVGLTKLSGQLLGVVLVDPKGNERGMTVEELAKTAADRGARLLVVESRDMPERMARVPLASPSDYRDLLQGTLETIVFTQYPVETVSLGTFNRILYQKLEVPGTTIESAVQSARAMTTSALARERDAAAYGAFIVVTHDGGSPFLLRPSAARSATTDSPGSARAGSESPTAPRPELRLGRGEKKQ